MVHTILFRPAWPLNEDVQYIAIREFNSLEEILIKSMPAKHEINLMFMIDSMVHDFKNHPNGKINYRIDQSDQRHCTFSGILTSMAGSMVFKGPVKLLVIHFTPTGFYRVSGISPKGVTDCFGRNSDLLSNDVTRLHEELHYAKTSSEMFTLTQEFLLASRDRQKTTTDCPSITKASKFLLSQPGIFSIDELQIIRT